VKSFATVSEELNLIFINESPEKFKLLIPAKMVNKSNEHTTNMYRSMWRKNQVENQLGEKLKKNIWFFRSDIDGAEKMANEILIFKNKLSRLWSNYLKFQIWKYYSLRVNFPKMSFGQNLKFSSFYQNLIQIL
jgi:hypothetical protein